MRSREGIPRPGRPGFNSPDLVARLASGHDSPQPQHRERGRDPMKTAVVVQRLDLSIDYNRVTLHLNISTVPNL